MAKKKEKKEKQIQDASTLSRINFLHQAAHIVPLPLQRHYLTTSKTAMKKTMLRLYFPSETLPVRSISYAHCRDPKLKRLTCKRCSALISPQSRNVATRLVEGRGRGVDMLEVECIHCRTRRRFPVDDKYTLYSEKEPVERVQVKQS
jgi:RNase P subunit RPR2